MNRRIWSLGVAGIFILASGAFAQYQLELTGVGDGANIDNVYVSPYQGTISVDGTQIYSGYMICDDFFTESFLDDPWSATATNAGNLNGSEKFSGAAYSNATVGQTTTQQDYDAVAWLANGLLQASNVDSWTAQTNFSFAIWDIFDGANTDPDGGAMALITQAFNAVKNGYAANNVTVFTPNPQNTSQEFLVVNGPPVSAPEPSSAALLGIDIAGALAMVFFLRRKARRA